MHASKTYLIDVDGTVLRHLGTNAGEQWNDPNLDVLPGVRETLGKLEADGHLIVLCTARPDTQGHRIVLERLLQRNGVPYHKLVMGLTAGPRIVVNDRKSTLDCPACAISIMRNEGLTYGRLQGADCGGNAQDGAGEP